MTAGRRHWSKLPPVHFQFIRIEDEPGTGRRMVRCRGCSKSLPSLGIGYHLQNHPDCSRRLL